MRNSTLVDLLDRLAKEKWLASEIDKKPSAARAKELLPLLKGSRFLDIGEFGRTVHAEMAALMDAARRGVSVNKLTMHVTTFPCHNCAKHIIAAGIKTVVYLEPYPKSRAEFLHGEELDLDPIGNKGRDDKVVFIAFSGVGPRQYQQLFSMSARGSKKGIALNDWNAKRTTLLPRYVARNASIAYLVAEREELGRLPDSKFKWDKTKICPNR